MAGAWLHAVSSWLEFAGSRASELWSRTGEHLVLTGASTSLAVLVGLPLGTWAATRQWRRTTVLGVIGVLQTVPSLAMLAILLALIGKIGTVPAIIALILYALLPIVRNTVTGIEGVPQETVEAARGIGMTPWQQLIMVQLPLAVPVILAGIRTAAVVGVGIATLSAFIGAGGLGQFINRGLALSDTRLILLGAIPAALLAILVDAAIALTAWGMRPVRRYERHSMVVWLRRVALAIPLLLFGLGIIAAFQSRSPAAGAHNVIRIGSKNFTEQLLLGELMAQLIEEQTDLTVDRRLNLGGTMICHEALVAGEIDLYAEYTGTGLVTVLKRPSDSDPDKVLRVVRQEYEKQFQLTWLDGFGFNNTYALTVRQSDARRNGWETVSDLATSADSLRAGFTAEFAERPDGYPGVRQAYRLDFADVYDLEPSLMYEAVAGSEVDVICAFSTAGRIRAYDLQPLVDDRRFFPPYDAAPVIRADVLAKNPKLRDVFSRLAGTLTEETMQRLNHEVDGQGRPVEAVVRDFLRENQRLKSE